MDVTKLIQIAVARADLLLCSARATLPWGKMALSLLLAALAIHVIKAVRQDG